MEDKITTEEIMAQFKERLTNAIEFNWTGGFERKFLENWLEKMLDEIKS